MADDCTKKGVLEAAHAEYEAMIAAEEIGDGVETHGGQRYMRDHRGALIPVETISETRLLQDQTARRLIAKALRASRAVQAFRAEVLGDFDAFTALLSERYQAQRGGMKGNICLMTHDQLFKVERSIGEFISFGPELEVARDLVQECLREWSDGANANLRAVVDRAFQVDKKGRVRQQELLGLMSLQIDDDRWTRAMQAIRDSISIVGQKEYPRFYRRARVTDRWQPITIDVSSEAGDRRAA